MPKNQTFAAVAIGGLDWNSEVDVLKADLNRCDGLIPKWHNKNTYRHGVVYLFKKDIYMTSSILMGWILGGF